MRLRHRDKWERGGGKMVTAEAIAGELGNALQLVRLDAVVSKYVGETARSEFDYSDEHYRV